jgi:hypothetical protein
MGLHPGWLPKRHEVLALIHDLAGAIVQNADDRHVGPEAARLHVDLDPPAEQVAGERKRVRQRWERLAVAEMDVILINGDDHRVRLDGHGNVEVRILALSEGDPDKRLSSTTELYHHTLGQLRKRPGVHEADDVTEELALEGSKCGMRSQGFEIIQRQTSMIAQCETAAAASSLTSWRSQKRERRNGSISAGMRRVAISSAMQTPEIGAALKP